VLPKTSATALTGINAVLILLSCNQEISTRPKPFRTWLQKAAGPLTMPREIKTTGSLSPGDFYEDCTYHPCLCISVNEGDDEICGISLVDGSSPRQLTFEEAVRWKLQGPADVEIDVRKR
jgi:hypothetical protein